MRSPAEIVGRLRQAGSVAVERAGFAPRSRIIADPVMIPRLPFPRPSAEELTLVYAARPAERAVLLRHADALAEGRFSLLGYHDLDFGTPVDWHRDPIRNLRAPRGHWSTVPYLDASRIGDHKVIWELNRHQWLVTLAQASRLTGRRSFLDCVAQYLTEWLDENPPRTGINWASSLEVAFRSIAWTWVLHLAGGDAAIGPALASRLMESLDAHGRHVEKYLSRWFSPNTHLTGEALGLLYLGCAWPDLPRSRIWRETGWEILIEQLPIHLRDDGTYFEQTSWYLGYTVDFYLHAAALGASLGWELPGGHRDRLAAGVRALEQFMYDDGTLVLAGDDDGGRLLPLAPGAGTDFCDTLAVAAAVLGEVPERPPPAGTVWLIGTERWRAFAAANSDTRAPRASSALPDGGTYFLRSADGGSLSIDAGPHGGLSAGHAHADALAIELRFGNMPVLMDAGTFSYIGGDRDFFRTTPAHNTMTLDGQGSARPGGPFGWANRPTTTMHHWLTATDWDYFEASHDGFEARFPGVRHERSVLRWGTSGWLVIDRLSGPVPALRGELRFHFAPGIILEELGPGAFHGAAPGGTSLVHLVTDAVGGPVPDTGWVSRCYGARETAPVLVRRVSSEDLRSGVATLLRGGNTGGTLVRSSLGGGVGWTWSTTNGPVLVLLRNPGADAVRAGEIISTARFCVVAPPRGDSPAGVIIPGPGTALREGTSMARLQPNITLGVG